jgi:hypothetical protein
MADELELELVVESQVESVISEVEATLGPVVRQRLPPARILDPAAILGLAAGAVQLINALLDLRDRLASRPDPPAVTVRNAQSDEIDLRAATQSEIESFVEDTASRSA